MTSYSGVQDCVAWTYLTAVLYLSGTTADSGGDEGEKQWNAFEKTPVNVSVEEHVLTITIFW